MRRPATAEVVVVTGRLDPPADREARLAATLSPAERARAARAADPEGRRRATVSRGLLREVLGRACGRAPAELDLRVAPGGRPRLADDAVRFSVAHCGERLLIALSADRDVGVDLERHRTVMDAAAVARRALAPDDARRIAALAEPARSEALIAAWTRMEARFKATGGAASRLATVRGLDVGPGWSAAVAAAGDDGWRLVRGAG
jgi:4'-phosphopantetheinyl transferase